MLWQITSFPNCERHVFLSHCGEDRDRLVYPVYDELQRRGIIPWLDRDDYAYGRDSRTSVRDGLLRSRHVVFFVTRSLMAYRRGWCQMELAYSDLLQANLVHAGGPLLNVELPLFFIPRANRELPQTVWSVLQDRGRFHRRADGDRVAWATEQIVGFLRREQSLALDMVKAATPGEDLRDHLRSRPGLYQRVTQFDPGAIA